MYLFVLLTSFFVLLIIGCPISYTLLISSFLTLLFHGLPLSMLPQNLVGGAEKLHFTGSAVLYSCR